MGNPAASAEVHVLGRFSSAARSQTAAEPAFHAVPAGNELYSSYSQQLLLSSTRTWRSPFPGIGYPSIGAVTGMGIGPDHSRCHMP